MKSRLLIGNTVLLVGFFKKKLKATKKNQTQKDKKLENQQENKQTKRNLKIKSRYDRPNECSIGLLLTVTDVGQPVGWWPSEAK